MKTMKSPVSKLVILSILITLSSVVFAEPPPPALSPPEQLGKLIFFDKMLSTPIGQSCAACHAERVGWTGPEPFTNLGGSVYQGAVHGRFGNRKPPSSGYAFTSPDFYYDAAEGLFVGGQFWDGRAVNLVAQAKGPFLNPLEQNNPDAQTVCTKIAAGSYAGLFEQVYGPGSLDCFGNIDATYHRIAQAVAVFESSRAVNPFNSKYDRFLAGKETLTDQELSGLQLFEGKANCAACHVTEPTPEAPAMFTDFTYDNIGVPKNPLNPFYNMPPEFNPDGANWVDPGLGGFLANTAEYQGMAPANMGKMKVPTLRNVDKRPGDLPKAYMHNGVFKSLKQVVHFYNTRDLLPRCDGSGSIGVDCWPAPEVGENVNSTELGNLGLTDTEENAIVAFMQTLSDPIGCNERYPVIRFITDGGGQTTQVNATLSATFTGHIVASGKGGVTVCPGTLVDVEVHNTIGTAVCRRNNTVTRTLSKLKTGDVLTCTNKPAGLDTDRFRIGSATEDIF